MNIDIAYLVFFLSLLVGAVVLVAAAMWFGDRQRQREHAEKIIRMNYDSTTWKVTTVEDPASDCYTKRYDPDRGSQEDQAAVS